MSQQAPTVSDEIAAFLAQGVSLLVGTCDASHRPHSTRAVGLRLHPDRHSATVYLASATSRNTVTNMRENPRIALCTSYPLDHRSLQFKGAVLRVEPAAESERAHVESYIETFARVLEVVGMPFEMVMMVTHWPAVAVAFRIDELYVQTPGPGAGDKLSGASL